MSDQHSCSYHCDRPECIREQRDQLRDWMESVSGPLTDEKDLALKERHRRCREMIELLRGDRHVSNGITWSTEALAGFERQGQMDLGTVELPTIEALRIADELQRLITKVPFLERYIAKLEAEVEDLEKQEEK